MSVDRAKTRRIGKNHFRLIGKDNLYFKGQHIVAFTPLPKNKVTRNRSILPTFNHDGKYYTYAFQLPSSPPDSPDQMLEEHEKRAADSLVQLSELWVPKPRSRHKYCGVCRGHYEDYLEHTESELHLNHLRTSRYQELIRQMAQCFQCAFQKKDNEDNKPAEMTAQQALSKGTPEVILVQSSIRGPHL